MMSGDGRRWFRLLLVAFALSSALFNVLLVRELQRAFSALHFSRVFPLGYAPAELADSKAILAPEIAFWGDSRGLAWGRSSMFARPETLNLAHGGQTSSQVLAQLQQVPSQHVRFAVMQVGINDLHPLGALAPHRDLIMKRLFANLKEIRDQLLARSDYVVMTTILPPARVPLLRHHAWDPQTPELLERVNNEIRRLSGEPRVLFLDTHALLVGMNGRIQPRFEDPDFFLHVNDEAYRTMSEALSRLLAPYRS